MHICSWSKAMDKHFNKSKNVLLWQVLGIMNLTKEYSILHHMGKEKKEMCQGSCSMGFLLDHKSLKTCVPDVERSFTCRWLVELCQKVVNLKNEVDEEEEAKMFWWGVSYSKPHLFVHWECGWSTSAKWTHWTFNGSYKIGKHCSYFSMSKSFL